MEYKKRLMNLKRRAQFGHLTILLLVLTLILFSPDVSATPDKVRCNALIILDSTDIGSTKEAISHIREKGGRVVHSFPPHILIGYVPENIIQDLIGKSYIRKIHYNQVVEPSTVEKYGKTAVYAVDAWNNNFMGLAKEKGLTPKPGVPGPGPIIGDMIMVPPETFQEELKKPFIDPLYTAKGYKAPYGASFYDTSEYMIGHRDKSWNISVSIIFPESNGLTDQSTEDWTDAEISEVISEIQTAFHWWGTIAPVGVNFSFIYTFERGVSTSYEPINRPSTRENLWIDEVMTNLGYYSGNYINKVYSYINGQRDLYETDWALAIFVVDSSNDADNCFADGDFAYAYVGGPFMVMTYGNDNYGIANMDAVCAHEIGHIFYACDEYADSTCSVNCYNGYLNIQNGNHETNGITNVACIMRGGVDPFTNYSICEFTKQQIGWRDTDMDWKHDITDTFPTSSLNTYFPDPTDDTTLTYTGSTHVNPYPNSNLYTHAPSHPRNNITINTISNVEYRVDCGRWSMAEADDGRFNEGVEDFYFISNQLSYGTHFFEVRAENTTSWISDNTEEPPYANDTLTIKGPGSIFGEVRGAFWENPIAGIKVEVLPIGEIAYTNNNGTYRITDIQAGTYYVKISKDSYFSETRYNVVVESERDIQVDFLDCKILLSGTVHDDNVLGHDDKKGPLYGDGIPYHIHGNVTVPQDKTLTIKPGAKIYFNPGCKITANGTLEANGTPDKPIEFYLAGEERPSMRLYHQLRLKNGGYFKP